MAKPFQINPLKLSQPMGALLAFLGIKNCMPLMHGAQGCASFSKVFFTRHFNDPIAIQTTAVNDITAVIDGGDYSISEAIKNITAKVTPDLVGLFTTGLTETKGDDIKGATILLKDKQKIVYVNTPDFEGGLESGWSLSVQSIISQLIKPRNSINPNKLLLLPNVNLTPIEVEKIKESIALFGFDVVALPDLSESLDGHLGEKQGALSSGGVEVSTIEALGDAGIVISIGESMRKCGEKFKTIQPLTQHFHVNGLSGLIESDNFYKILMEYKDIKTPPLPIIRWRKRLQDALLDTHFLIGSADIAIADEPDKTYSLAKALNEAGANILYAFVPTKSAINEHISATNTAVGDMEDLENILSECEIIISNFHGERIAHKHHKSIMLRGFPNYETVGNGMKNDVLYEGSCYLLFELANLIREHRENK